MLPSLAVALCIVAGSLAVRHAGFSRAGGWCTHGGASIVSGDFDGDGKSDVMCYDGAGNHWIRYAKIFRQDEHFPPMNGWCTHGGSKRHIGDFNGDGRDDLMCHDRNGNLWIAVADHNGMFAGTSWHEAAGWCTGDDQLHIGDFNGDSMDDILCHTPANGYKRVALAAPNNFFHAKTSWEGPLGWCFHPGSKLLTGNFNKDPYADLLCHDSSGRKWIALGQHGTYFEGFKQTWYRDMNWCSHAGSELDLADVNGDSVCDLVCHDPNGNTWFSVNVPGKFFDVDNTQYFKFCFGNNNRFLIGNFGGDFRDDILCTANPIWLVMDDVNDKK